MNTEMPHSNIYRIFGLDFLCSLPYCRQFGTIQSSGNADASIHTGMVPTELSGAVYRNKYISYMPRCVLLDIKGVARYLIRSGNEIIIEADTGAKDLDVGIYAFGSAMGILLYQRGILALHGSAVRTSEGAVIFSGKKGAGKSTLASALSLQGFSFMSDDICAVYLEKGKPFLYPGLSNAKLCLDSYTNVIGCEPCDPLLSPVSGKYGASFGTNREPCRLRSLCIIESTIGHPYIEQVKGAERLSILAGQVYRPMMYELVTESEEQFCQYSAVSSHISVFKIHRTNDFSQMQELLDLIQSQVLA